MGRSILEGLGYDPDTYPDFELPRTVLIEGEDLLAAFDRGFAAKMAKKTAGFPDDDPTTWSAYKHELNARTASINAAHRQGGSSHA